MTFPAAVPDVMIYAGDTYEQTYTFTDSTGDPVDFVAAGYTEWYAQYRTSRDAIEHLDFTVVHTDADEGVIVVKLTHEKTSTITENGVWDLKAKKGTKFRTFITSSVNVTQGVTLV